MLIRGADFINMNTYIPKFLVSTMSPNLDTVLTVGNQRIETVYIINNEYDYSMEMRARMAMTCNTPVLQRNNS